MISTRTCLLGLALATVLPAGAATAPPATTAAAATTATTASVDDLELATVNDDPVTVREVVALFNKRHAGHATFLGGNVEARRFLDMVIDDRLLTQEGYALGIDELPEVQKYVDDYTRSEMSKWFVSAEITEKVKATPDEVKAIWEKQITTFIHARHIVVASRAEAEEIRAALMRGSDFEALARACSTNESRRRGGNVMAGWGQFDPEWERVVFALEEGEISPVIEVEGRFEVVQVSRRVDVPRPEFEKVASKIEEALYQRNLAARKKEVAAALWTKYDARILVDGWSAGLLQKLLASAPHTIAASWNGGSLTIADVFDKAELDAVARMNTAQAGNALYDELRQTVNAPLVALEARALKMDEVPVVAKEIERYRDYVVESVLFRDHIFRSVDVGDGELKKYYEEHLSEFEVPEQRRVAQIMVASEADAKKVHAEASAPGADFAALAKKHSKDMVSAASGGDLGLVSANKVPAAFAEVLKLQAGQVCKPMKSSTGWHVVKVLEILPKSTPPFAEITEKVKERAIEARRREARSFWVKKLRAASVIKVDDAAIAAFVKAHQSSGPPPQHGM